MRIAFLGTPEVAVPALEAIVAAPDIDVAAVVTNPDRPRGRSSQLVSPPVKEAALAAGLRVWQPRKPREIVDDLHALELDACAVVAYGALLPADVLVTGGHGFVNLHFSLLPRWRGAAPVQHAIRAGDAVTGVTTFVLDEGMDTGPVLARREVAIRPDESAGQLLERLARLGAPVLVESLRSLVGGARPEPQSGEATVAPKITPDDVALDLGEPAAVVDRVARSADPSPGAHTTFRGNRLKVFRASPLEGERAPVEAGDARPGAVIARDRRGVIVACGGSTAVRLDSVQPEGKARMDGAAFANGYRAEPGELLGPSQ